MRRKSLCILFSFFILVFASCTKQATSLLDAPDCMYSDGEFMFVKWAGYRWAVILQYELSKSFRFELLLMDGHESYFVKIRQAIIEEFGEPYMTDLTMPRDTVPDLIISEVFLLGNGRYPDEKESLTFWKTETPNLTSAIITHCYNRRYLTRQIPNLRKIPKVIPFVHTFKLQSGLSG